MQKSEKMKNENYKNSVSVERTLRERIKVLKEENAIIQCLSTSLGFYKFYFERLKDFKNKAECFNYVNKKFENLFGEQAYKDYK